MSPRFPEGFRWGTATAAHQVEGQTTGNDWWDWEHAAGTPCAEPSGDACDQYHLYDEDVRLLAALGFDNYRFSVEWSRIEPSEGEISRAALEHYRRVCASCLAHGIQPVVTFHHFTTPRWAAADGGWDNPAIVERFARFCEVTAGYLGDLIGRACTINEPNVVAFVGHVMGFFPPGGTDLSRLGPVTRNFLDAHRRAVEAIKSANDAIPTGLTLSMSDYQAAPEEDERAQRRRDRAREAMEDVYLAEVAGDDFLGVQTYSRTRFGPDGMLGPEEGVEVVEHMGYEFWPQALEVCIRNAAAATSGMPLLVTENGLSTADDSRRTSYVHSALQGVLACLEDGIDVRGYTYWSLLDNFEWAYGYAPRFGLVSVDRTTQRREPKPSALWLGEVARSNQLVEPPAPA